MKLVLFAGAAALALGSFLVNGPAAPRTSARSKVGNDPGGVREGGTLKPKPGDRLAAFAGGCFWGTEDGFRQVPGVVATAVGYAGGHTKKPTYEDVCTHTTGHAETVLVEFDPKRVSYGDLLNEFWRIHDPTTVDRQGPDVGDNYRSAIWAYGDDELQEARASRNLQQKREKAKIVTEIRPAPTFWLAEDYHQQYAERTGTHGCPAPRWAKPKAKS